MSLLNSLKLSLAKSILCVGVVLLMIGLSDRALGQSNLWIGPLFEREASFRQNSISVVGSNSQGIWIGPGLEFATPPFNAWNPPVGLDSVNQGLASLYSLHADGDYLYAGLGATTQLDDETIPRAAGYGISRDMGTTWSHQPFSLDPEPDASVCPDPSLLDEACDILFSYGLTEYRRVRITVPEQSPPYDLFSHHGTLYAAHWASGVKMSTDEGQSWQFVPLPPQSASSMSPSTPTSWSSTTSIGSIERYDPRSDNNLLGFSVHVDEVGHAFIGTAGGLNVSEDLYQVGPSQASWTHIQTNGSSRGLVGNWIIRIRQHPETSALWMTNWPTSASEQYGLVTSNDGGRSFSQHLLGQKINDIGFVGSTILAVGNNVYRSIDGGVSWSSQTPLPVTGNQLPQSTEFFSVDTYKDWIVVGSSQGLLVSQDKGVAWELIRVDYPLSGQHNSRTSDEVDGYVYPNPFSPTIHEFARIRFNIPSPMDVSVSIFDGEMRRIYQSKESVQSAGVFEVLWNGQTTNGLEVHNGVYFVQVKGGNELFRGKILVIQ